MQLCKNAYSSVTFLINCCVAVASHYNTTHCASLSLCFVSFVKCVSCGSIVREPYRLTSLNKYLLTAFLFSIISKSLCLLINSNVPFISNFLSYLFACLTLVCQYISANCFNSSAVASVLLLLNKIWQCQLSLLLPLCSTATVSYTHLTLPTICSV